MLALLIVEKKNFMSHIAERWILKTGHKEVKIVRGKKTRRNPLK